MKKMTQEEFEKQVERLIKGEISRKELAKELETDLRTLKRAILKISETNPELYKTYVEKFPYRSKRRDDIDYEALVIEAIVSGVSLDVLSENYGVSIKTISRRIRDLEKTNPRLIKIYRIHASDIKRSRHDVEKFRDEISELVQRKVKITEINGKRKEKLQKIKIEFEKLISQGISNDDAAKKLGYSGNDNIWKLLQQLRMIEIEENVISQRDKNKKFRDGFKTIPNTSKNHATTEQDSKTKDTEIIR